jgi:hypothetical protein
MHHSSLLGCGNVDGQAVPDVSKERVVLTLKDESYMFLQNVGNHFSENQNPQMR